MATLHPFMSFLNPRCLSHELSTKTCPRIVRCPKLVRSSPCHSALITEILSIRSLIYVPQIQTSENKKNIFRGPDLVVSLSWKKRQDSIEGFTRGVCSDEILLLLLLLLLQTLTNSKGICLDFETSQSFRFQNRGFLGSSGIPWRF